MSLQSWGTYRMGGGLAVGQVEGVGRVWSSAADLEGKGIKSYQDTLNQQAKLGLWANHSAERNLEVWSLGWAITVSGLSRKVSGLILGRSHLTEKGHKAQALRGHTIQVLSSSGLGKTMGSLVLFLYHTNKEWEYERGWANSSRQLYV